MVTSREAAIKILLASLSLEFPLAAYCLAATLRANPALRNCSVALYDADWQRVSSYESKNAENWRFLAQLEQMRPDVLGLSVYLWNNIAFRELAAIARRLFPNMCIVVGGPEVATTDAAATWLSSGDANVVIRGEGERTLEAAILRMTDGVPVAGLPGTSAMSDGSIVHGSPAPKSRSLAALPSPFLDGLVPEGMFRSNRPLGSQALYPQALIETYRGCYMECAYCQWGNGDKSRFAFPIDRVKKEISWLLSQDVHTIFVVDAMFGFKKAVAIDILKFIIAEKSRLRATTEFNLYHNQDFRDPALFDLYREAGVHIEIDLQSTNSAVLTKLGRGRWTTDVFERQLAAVENHRVPTTGAADLIIGIPGDDLASFEASVDYLLRKRLRVNLYQASILPDTAWGRNAGADGVVSSPLPPRAILKTGDFSLADMLAARLIGHGTDFFNSFPVSADILWNGWFDRPVDLCKAIGDRVFSDHGLMYGESHQYSPSMEDWLEVLPEVIEALCPDRQKSEILIDLMRFEGALAAATWTRDARRVHRAAGWSPQDEGWRKARPKFRCDLVQRVSLRWPVGALAAEWAASPDVRLLDDIRPMPHVELVFRADELRHIAIDRGVTDRLLERFNGYFSVDEALRNIGVGLADMSRLWQLLSMLADTGVIVPGPEEGRTVPPVPQAASVAG